MAFEFTLCADDYGMAPGVSRGILELASAGRISAASAMTNLPDWPRAALAWREAGPPADLGLHLTLTTGAPLGAMPRLAPAGRLPTLRAVIEARDATAEIEAEFSRQIEAFTAAMDRAPSHIDGHQHVHALPHVRAALFCALARAGLGALRLRDCGDRLDRLLRRPGARAKALTIAALTRGFAAQARRMGHTCNEGFAGVSRFVAGADLAVAFATYLVAPGPRHLIMCHPGLVDEALIALDPVTQARESELAFLRSDRWPALMDAHGARLIRRDA